MQKEMIVGDYIELKSNTNEFYNDLECCDCADPETGSENCMCEDF